MRDAYCVRHAALLHLARGGERVLVLRQHGARQLVGQLAIRARLDDAQSPRTDLKSARRNAGRKASASSLPPVWRTALSSSLAAS
ncbi:hypothetical protein G6F59_017955 [Rhizopus arrhizus]|nr:hypothetical protein G6F59_017955 [Rhizopus arrhizus]